MPSWNIPPGPTHDEFMSRVREIQEGIDNGSEGDVRDQHFVSRALLKPFAAPIRGKGSGLFLTPHHLQWGQRPPRGLRGCAKQENFLWGASASAEKLWKDEVEDHISEAVSAVRVGGLGLGTSDYARVIKDTIALHYVRSLRWQEAHRSIVRQVMAEVRREVLSSRRPIIDQEFRRLYGLDPAGDQAREIVVDDSMAEWRKWDASGALSRASIEFTFRRVRQALRELPLEVMHVPAGDSLLISDAPAFTMRYPQGPEETTKLNLALGDSHTVALPLAPDCLVGIGAIDQEGELRADQVAFLNRVQVDVGHTYVYYTPGNRRLAQFVVDARGESKN